VGVQEDLQSNGKTVSDRRSTLSFHVVLSHILSLGNFSSSIDFLTWGSLSDSPKEPDLRDVGLRPKTQLRDRGRGGWGLPGDSLEEEGQLILTHTPQQRIITCSKTTAHLRELSLESDQ